MKVGILKQGLALGSENIALDVKMASRVITLMVSLGSAEKIGKNSGSSLSDLNGYFRAKSGQGKSLRGEKKFISALHVMLYPPLAAP